MDDDILDDILPLSLKEKRKFLSTQYWRDLCAELNLTWKQAELYKLLPTPTHVWTIEGTHVWTIEGTIKLG